ncbi:hypothetical protein, partial [Rathayibacter tritici]
TTGGHCAPSEMPSTPSADSSFSLGKKPILHKPLCTDGDLLFPPLVVRDCREFGETDLVTSWVRSNAVHLSSHAPGYDLAGQVMCECPALFDVDDERESAEIEVLALALSRRNDRVSVAVVTGQWIDSPIRQSLGSAAIAMNFDTMSTREFVDSVMA